jgi:hypothetical protein
VIGVHPKNIIPNMDGHFLPKNELYPLKKKGLRIPGISLYVNIL